MHFQGQLGSGPSLVAQTVKNLPVKQETQVRSLGHDDPLEQGIGNPPSIITWKIPWTEVPGEYSPWDRKESYMTERLTHTQTGFKFSSANYLYVSLNNVPNCGNYFFFLWHTDNTVN